MTLLSIVLLGILLFNMRSASLSPSSEISVEGRTLVCSFIYELNGEKRFISAEVEIGYEGELSEKLIKRVLEACEDKLSDLGYLLPEPFQLKEKSDGQVIWTA